MTTLPIVFLPGASGRAAFLRPLAERLHQPDAAVLVDYPGLGDVPARADIADADKLFQAVLRDLPARFDLVAISMGSLFGLRTAIEHRERVRRLVLIAPVGGFDARHHGASDWRPGFRTRRPEAPTWLLDDATDLTGLLDRVAAPTLIIVGDQDAISPPACGRFLAEHIGRARLEVIAGGTHDLDEEYPDIVTGLIADHLHMSTGADG
jgi:pimeloyl-ACP methyl ester carboxylesterase